MANKEIRALAREQLKGNWWKFVLYTLVIFVITGIPSFVFKDNQSVTVDILSVVLTIIIAVFTTGLYLNFVRTKQFNLSEGIRNWKVYLRFLGVYILIMIIAIIIAIIVTFIPMVLFFIVFSGSINEVIMNYGGSNLIGFTIALVIVLTLAMLAVYIIISLFFMATPYLLIDNVTIGKSISGSFKLMKGNKWRLFKLQLSFIGWFLLGIITLGIGLLWVTPYFKTAMSNFYLEIREEKQDLI